MRTVNALVVVLFYFVAQAAAQELPSATSVDRTPDWRVALDRWLDLRYEAASNAELLDLLREHRIDLDALEAALRSGRASYPEPPEERGKLSSRTDLACDHVDHQSAYMIYVPTNYDPVRAAPLLLVAHGGSATRDLAFGARAALAGLRPFWIEEAEARGWIVVAPLTDRGWMHIGNSILFSALSKVQREYHIDPDRIYLTGHSMGGHMTWRSAYQFPDRFAAVSPMSGGYDYVKSQHVVNLLNVPGYTTYGKQEPYQINEFNNIIAQWMREHRYPWKHAEKAGGHQIFPDEVKRVAEFFAALKRDLYRKHVYARFGAHPYAIQTADQNEAWGKQHEWNRARAIPASTAHWLRAFPLDPETPPEQRIQTISARYHGANRFELQSQNARRLRIYLHPRMIDFTKPVQVIANGEVVFDRSVSGSAERMLELVREYDDRGRVFHAAIDIDILKDGTVAEPLGNRD